jgi:hypothetical protein
MNIEFLRITDVSREELPEALRLLSAGGWGANIADTGVAEQEADGDSGSAGNESTRERGLKRFLRWAQDNGLRARRSGSKETGTFIVSTSNGDWPVEVICSRRPRISLRKEWAKPENLVLAFVWLENDRVFFTNYSKAYAVLEDAAFTPEGFYTKALSPGAVETLMETGAFGSESEALEYFLENGIPGLRG